MNGNTGDTDGFPSKEEFIKWMDTPGELERYQAYLKELRARPDLPAEFQASLDNLLAKLEKRRSIKVVNDKIAELREVMQRPPGTMYAEDRLEECRKLFDEITDALLETPEPMRTTFLKGIIPLRDKIRAWKIE
jgi:hypothetical protein